MVMPPKGRGKPGREWPDLDLLHEVNLVRLRRLTQKTFIEGEHDQQFKYLPIRRHVGIKEWEGDANGSPIPSIS